MDVKHEETTIQEQTQSDVTRMAPGPARRQNGNGAVTHGMAIAGQVWVT